MNKTINPFGKCEIKSLLQKSLLLSLSLSLSLFYNHPTFIFEMLAFIDSSKYIIMIPLKIEMKS